MPDENILDNEQQEEEVEVNEERVIDKIWIESEHKHPLGGLAENILLEEGNPISVKDVLLTKSEKEYYNDNYIYINGGQGNETRHNESAVIGTNLRTWNDNQIVIGQRDTYNEKNVALEEELRKYNFIVCNSNAAWSPAALEYQTEAAFAIGGEEAKFQVPVTIQGDLEVSGPYSPTGSKSFNIANDKITTDMTLEVDTIKSSNQNNKLTFDNSTEVSVEGDLDVYNFHNKKDVYWEVYPSTEPNSLDNMTARISFYTQPSIQANVTVYHRRNCLGEHHIVLQFSFDVSPSSAPGNGWTGRFLYPGGELEVALRGLLKNYIMDERIESTYTSWSNNICSLQIRMDNQTEEIYFQFHISEGRITDKANPRFRMPLYLKRSLV